MLRAIPPPFPPDRPQGVCHGSSRPPPYPRWRKLLNFYSKITTPFYQGAEALAWAAIRIFIGAILAFTLGALVLDIVLGIVSLILNGFDDKITLYDAIVFLLGEIFLAIALAGLSEFAWPTCPQIRSIRLAITVSTMDFSMCMASRCSQAVDLLRSTTTRISVSLNL